MFCDFHMHSCYSFDGAPEATPENICKRAVELGLKYIAITDHYDVNGEVEKIYKHYEDEKAYADIMEAREKYRGVLELAYGIELGQVTEYPDEAHRILSLHDFDFVLGSVHNLRGVPDFSNLKYDNMTDAQNHLLFERCLSELCETVESGLADSLAHITYMTRYTARCGVKFDLTPHYEHIRALLRMVAERDMALEINTSTYYRGGMGFTMPDADILKMYRECGGKIVSVGSDAHSLKYVGTVDIAKDVLEAAGFDSVAVWLPGHKREIIKL